MMRVTRWVPSLLLASLVLAASAPHAGAADGEDEDWAHIQGIAIGDHWKYQITGQENGEIENVVAAQERKTSKFGKTWDTYRIDAHADLESKQRPGGLAGTDVQLQETTVRMWVDASKWVRDHDYGVVHIEGDTQVEERSESTTIHVWESYDPPLVEMVFPFAEGYEWKTGAYWQIQRGNEPREEPSRIQQTVMVLAKEEIEVPAGTFTTWKIKITGGQSPDHYKLQWYSEEACDLVKEERYSTRDGEELINTMELVDFHCSRTEKADPTYDTDWVVLQKTGGKLPPLPGFEKNDPGDATNEAGGIDFGIVLLTTTAGVAAVGSGLVLLRQRRQ